MQTTFRIDAEDAGARLDVYLSRRLPSLSRSRIQRLIKDGAVLLNGRPARPHAALGEGDEVEAALPPPAAEGLVPRPDVAVPAVHEDEDVLVVDKPAGMLVHPATEADDATMVHGLIAAHPGIIGVGDAPERPGIVHRLDKDASGLIVVAKTAGAFDALKGMFQRREVEKEYRVLVEGAPPHDEGEVALAIGRKARGGRMAARPDAGEGDRDALTRYRVLERLPGATLLAVTTGSGRTHQIRVHMKALGCPVVGDDLYAAKGGPRVAAPRLFLHATRLAFSHPRTGKRLEFGSPLPAELEEVLERLRNAR
jgi:23S rRNA pseudouridine1911/1915/1917 synthase